MMNFSAMFDWKIVAALEGLGLEISTGKSLSSVTAVLRAGKSEKTVRYVQFPDRG